MSLLDFLELFDDGKNIDSLVKHYNRDVKRDTNKYKRLQDLDMFVLDNSIRESTVGQLRGHTLENKWQVYDEVRKCGFRNVIVASFSHMTRVDDVFIKQLVDKGEDRRGLYAFSEVTEDMSVLGIESLGHRSKAVRLSREKMWMKRLRTIQPHGLNIQEGAKDKIPDTETIPVGLQKMRELGLWNAILEIDLSDGVYNFSKFSMADMCALVRKWIVWIHKEMHADAKVLVNLRDLSDLMAEKPARAFELVKFLATLPNDERPFGLMFEEARGTCMPEHCGNWAKYIRKIMDAHKWQGKLLVHVHEKFGYADASQLESLMNGCDGTWGSICIEGAAMGNASTCVTLMNMIRLGNRKVLQSYNCSYLRKAANNVTQVTTGQGPHLKQPVYGERALDFVLGLAKEDFDLADFFGEQAPKRITTLASDEMIRLRLTELFGLDEQFTSKQAHKMKEVMLDDLRDNRKEEYMSHAGLALLFDRAGGKITEKMRDSIENLQLKSPHADAMIEEVRKTWDTWDLKDEVQGDEMLQFDSFYNGFMAPYFACYRCSDTRKALQAIDMDADGQVDWSEFLVYLKWALNQYPTVKNSQELLDITFRKGIIPAMRDELLKDSENTDDQKN